MSGGREHSRGSEGGFTLVELMLSVVISSILVFFLFSIQGRMSTAFRGQGTVSEINQNLRAAKHMLQQDVRMAGYGLSSGGKVFVSSAIGSPTTIPNATGISSGFFLTNNSSGDGNDRFRVLYADGGAESLVDSLSGAPSGTSFRATTVAPGLFAVNDVVVVSGTDVARNRVACIAQVSASTPFGAGTRYDFGAIGGMPYNEVNGAQCEPLLAGTSPVLPTLPITLRRLIARAYRIIPTADNAVDGYLQMSTSGGLIALDWQNIGVGFTNLQVATRFRDTASVTDDDADLDVLSNWYSGANQQAQITNMLNDVANPRVMSLIQVSVSVEGRNPFGARSASPSLGTSAFAVAGQINNNYLGDWGGACAAPNPAFCGVDLANVNDASRPLRYAGTYVYRHTTTVVDLRNM